MGNVFQSRMEVANRVGLINQDILLSQWLVQVIRQSRPWQAEIGFRVGDGVEGLEARNVVMVVLVVVLVVATNEVSQREEGVNRKELGSDCEGWSEAGTLAADRPFVLAPFCSSSRSRSGLGDGGCGASYADRSTMAARRQNFTFQPGCSS
jgi:hypothetical protein